MLLQMLSSEFGKLGNAPDLGALPTLSAAGYANQTLRPPLIVEVGKQLLTFKYPVWPGRHQTKLKSA
jgi:hypothetical protein